ncbi:unnamed protein product [Caenorhabditis auriculariae]|uniref:Uncharacterized protein n=1 Tax=Caenorhabditis auriculariae TaxID=2777116 RepID=A0A8S1GQ07_9PELO|nr:unnamed protein product [Caenorhabditis auriculariae]
MARNALGPTVGATASPQSAHTFPVIRVDEAPKIRPQIKPKPKPIDGPIIRLETSNEPRLNGSIGQPRKPLPPTRTPR